MNKTKKIWTLSLALATLLALTLSLTSCAQKDDGDYFSSSEVLGKTSFGNSYSNVSVYREVILFEETSIKTDEKVVGFALIVDSFNNNLWKYIVHYQTSYYDDSGNQTDYRSRQVYVKNKTDALKVYNEVTDYYKKYMSDDFRSATQYYGIDYDLEALMSDLPVSFTVQNKDGEKFSKSERIEARERQYTDNEGNVVKYSQGIYEERFVMPYVDAGNDMLKHGYFWVMDNGTNEYWPYAVYFFMDYFEYNSSTDNYDFLSESSAGVACKTKRDAKKVLQDMLNAFKEDSTLFTNMPVNYRCWQAYGDANDAPDYNLKTLLDY